MAEITLKDRRERNKKRAEGKGVGFWFFSIAFCCFATVVIVMLVLYFLRGYSLKYFESSDSDQSYVYLSGGNNERQGNVYAWNPKTNIIGPVCDDSWNILGADVVCKKLGYPGAEHFTINSYFGTVNDTYSYSNVKCFGGEESLAQCRNTDLYDCDETEGAGVICSTPSPTQPTTTTTTIKTAATTTKTITSTQKKNIYLVGGTSSYEGNLIALNPSTGIKGPVCDDFWSMRNANVVCKQLGFRAAIFRTIRSAYGNITDKFSYDNVFCYGDESVMDDCPHSDAVMCSPSKVAGVVCDDGSQSAILIGGNSINEGNVYTRNPSMNYVGPVCDESWGLEEAMVICNQLGYEGVNGITTGSLFGYVPTLFTYHTLSCFGNETSLEECSHTEDDTQMCSIGNGAGVRCYQGTKDITLVGGKGKNEGNIYMFNPVTRVYGPVCDDYWNLYGANVLCKRLGYKGALNATIQSYFGQVSDLFSYDNVKCNGNETELDDCHHINKADCNKAEGAGVVCGDSATVFNVHVSVNSNYTGMTKVLAISGYNDNSVEVVDLSDSEKPLVCDNLPDLPYGLDGAVGQLVNVSVPMVCGGFLGDYPTCNCLAYLNGTWTNQPNTKECRSYGSSVNISIPGRQGFTIFGGLNSRNALTNMESLNSNFTWTIGSTPDIPMALAELCIIKLNETTLLLTGGINPTKNFVSTLTYFYTIGNTGWVKGPNMNFKEPIRSCGLLKWQNPSTGFQEDIAVVAGGGTLQSDILNLRAYKSAGTGWSASGPVMPFKVYGGEIIQYQNSLIMVGGWQRESTDVSYLYQIKSPTDANWIQMPVKLKKRRSYHVAMLVPDSLVNCHA